MSACIAENQSIWSRSRWAKRNSNAPSSHRNDIIFSIKQVNIAIESRHNHLKLKNKFCIHYVAACVIETNRKIRKSQLPVSWQPHEVLHFLCFNSKTTNWSRSLKRNSKAHHCLDRIINYKRSQWICAANDKRRRKNTTYTISHPETQWIRLGRFAKLNEWNVLIKRRRIQLNISDNCQFHEIQTKTKTKTKTTFCAMKWCWLLLILYVVLEKVTLI